MVKDRLKVKGIGMTFFLLSALLFCGCGKEESLEAVPYDGEEYLRISEMVLEEEELESAAESYEPLININETLSVPTCITKVEDTWFIVDCYHDKVIYNSELNPSLYTYHVMASDLSKPHTMASDGTVYLVDDTENNRVVIYEKVGDKFINTQAFNEIGNRPHFTVYDENTDSFYVWSSESGEMYCFRRKADSTRVYLTDIRKIEELSDIYVRSFSIIDGDVYFVSGVSESGEEPRIYQCNLSDLSIKKSFEVPDELAGMVQITKIEDMYYITVSTDITGNQDYATIIRTASLSDLGEQEYEDIYEEYFIGGGTPYYINKVDDTYFLTEHRLVGHSIWSFKVVDGEIADVESVY